MDNPQPTPKGKRTIRENIYGNWNGYVSGRKFIEFGCDILAQQDAECWRETGIDPRNEPD